MATSPFRDVVEWGTNAYNPAIAGKVSEDAPPVKSNV